MLWSSPPPVSILSSSHFSQSSPLVSPRGPSCKFSFHALQLMSPVLLECLFGAWLTAPAEADFPEANFPCLGEKKKSMAQFEDFGLITDQEKQKSCVVFSSFSRSVFFSFSFHDLFFYNSFYSWTFSMEQLSPLDKHTLNKAWGMPSLVHV